MYLKLVLKNQKMSTCHRLDLGTLGSRPVMPQNLPGHKLTVIGEIFLGIISWDPSVCKSNRLHVDILRFFYINLRYIPWIPLKWSIILLPSWTSTGYSSNSTGSSVTNCRFSPILAGRTPQTSNPPTHPLLLNQRPHPVRWKNIIQPMAEALNGPKQWVGASRRLKRTSQALCWELVHHKLTP